MDWNSANLVANHKHNNGDELKLKFCNNDDLQIWQLQKKRTSIVDDTDDFINYSANVCANII